MGKEWLYWGGGKSTKRGGGRGLEREISSDNTTPSGCMSAVLQLFDFHPFQFSLHHQQPPPSSKPDSSFPEEPTINLKGVEAPRNSLEVQEPFNGATSLGGEDLNIPMVIQIRTSCDTTRSSKARTDDLSSEYSSSPGTKTPSLVARLMGLDLLPENSSPSLQSSNHSNSRQNFQVKNSKHDYQSRRMRSARLDTDIMGTRSLPETPRVSSERRSDVDHRLSLQINKENNGGGEEMEMSKSARRDKRLEDDIRSPSGYARQIVKQVRENVSRRVGADITNTIRYKYTEREEHEAATKRKKQIKAGLTKLRDEASQNKPSTPSGSPRLTTVLSSSTALINVAPKSSKVPIKPKTQQLEVQQKQNSIRICEKARSERFTHRLKKPQKASESIPNKQDEPFVRTLSSNRANQLDKKCKKSPLSTDFLSSTNVSTPFPVKKDPSPPSTKLPQKQKIQYSQVSDALSSNPSTQLFSYSSKCFTHSYKQKPEEATHMLTVQGINSHGNATTGDEAEFQYITKILKSTGIIDTSALTKWHHPLDPSLFHHLELSSTTATRFSRRSNRRLMFELVNEILTELSKKHMNDGDFEAYELMDRVWKQVKSYPLADCKVLEDIDKLIDLESWNQEEEGESIVCEIERDVTERLVHETAMVVWDSVRTVPLGRGGNRV